ncbi:MAG: PTS sugar transporter subunit IIA [Desulfomonile tiedjei]|uniref:PTS sugar transporter subunit IIA n=1 Tax=Desulfomonile tiedjei TaxID=2358 RepID=A0A9D6UZA6_9BACT|nr:PTS sugar transporter subunit IIA [Desulfomonile tiedjei]
MIRRAQRGRLKIYLGYGAGVGKTYQMLLEGHQLKAEGIDAVVGLVETHGRVDTAKLVEGLEVVPRRREEYRGVILEEMDVDAVLDRKPQVALIDELAHTNAPGSRNPKRYQDVQDILASGIHVITTLNIQHIESLYDTVEKEVHVKVRERLPDTVIAEADEIVNVDLTPEDLQKRLKEGKIYPPDRIQTALANFFRDSNLETLRELTLRELAAQIDMRRREQVTEEETATPDQVMVCLSSRGPNSETLLRYASRLAGRLNRNWYAVYVQTSSEAPTVVDSQTQRILSGTLTLAKQLGAIVFTYKGEDIPDTILRFAKEYRVGHIVIGSPGPVPFLKRLQGRKNVVEQLIDKARGMTVVVLDTRGYEKAVDEREPEPASGLAAQISAAGSVHHPALIDLLSSRRIVVWDQPVPKEVVVRSLLESANDNGIGDYDTILIELLKREQSSSTFFNEGVAFPHIRLEGLKAPIISMGIAKQGVSDVATDQPVKLVFLILCPKDAPDLQVRLLALVSRAAQNRNLLQDLLAATNGEHAFAAVRRWETPSDR